MVWKVDEIPPDLKPGDRVFLITHHTGAQHVVVTNNRQPPPTPVREDGGRTMVVVSRPFWQSYRTDTISSVAEVYPEWVDDDEEEEDADAEADISDPEE